MIYNDLTKKAMILAEEAHRGQFDKGGFPYIHGEETKEDLMAWQN